MGETMYKWSKLFIIAFITLFVPVLGSGNNSDQEKASQKMRDAAQEVKAAPTGSNDQAKKLAALLATLPPEKRAALLAQFIKS